EIHVELEQRLTDFLGTEATILYGSCFDANGGVFETLLGAEDAVISDALNHASIIDGIRLSKARRLRYDNGDLDQPAQRAPEPAAGWSRPRGSSRWTATSRSSTGSASWRSATGLWSWSTTPTRSASSASTAAARRSCSESPTASTCSPGPSARRLAGPAAA